MLRSPFGFLRQPGPAHVVLAFVLGCASGNLPAHAAESATNPVVATTTVLQWAPHDIALEAANEHPWWEFPVRAEFVHESSERLSVEGFWDGDRRWTIRFAATRPGVWTYRTRSTDRGLDGREGRIVATAPNAADIERNANLRGSLRISADRGRHFEFADGTPLFLLADTLWAANTVRCGLGANEDGPFFRYLVDRKARGFTAILIQYFHGYGDYPDSPGHRNEGGHAYFERDPARLNPAHFAALDRRLHALWREGFVAAIPTTWWGKTRDCLFSIEDARRVSAYCAVRYGAFNALWSLAGEYQYAMKDCGWTHADFTRLGETVQAHNPWRRPLSIHPSARIDWPAPHDVQSSRPFHGDSWLDHHWQQTGQSRERLFNLVTRLRDDRALTPPMPVFCSEALYESPHDPDGAYHMRWQAWAAWLNGSAGYGYGANGIWQFYDPADPHGETGKDVKDVVPWQQAIALPGSGQMLALRRLLATMEWWKFEPQRERISIDGQTNPLPSASDLSPPHAAFIGDTAAVLYIPRGNAPRQIAIALGSAPPRIARWFDPRAGVFVGEPLRIAGNATWQLPARPSPADEDWVFVIAPESATVFSKP